MNELDENGRCEREEIAMAQALTMIPYKPPSPSFVLLAEQVARLAETPPMFAWGHRNPKGVWGVMPAESKPDIMAAIREIARGG